MKNLFLKIISFLYHNYVGTYSFKFLGKFWSAVKASRIMFPFMVVWGVTKLFQVELYFSWLDGIFSLLFIIQYIAGFTNVVRKLYIKHSNEMEAAIIRHNLEQDDKD